MANTRIRQAIKSAREVLQNVQRHDIEIVVIGEDDPDPELTESGRQWVIQFPGDADEAKARQEWEKSLMTGTD